MYNYADWGGHWRKSTDDREGSWYRNYYTASGSILEIVRVFIEAKNKF
jgi:hypothetical protein